VADRAGLGWMSTLIKLGAIAGLVVGDPGDAPGQSRVFYSMSRDGLLPAFVNKVHPKFQTPYVTSIVTGVAVAFFARSCRSATPPAWCRSVRCWRS